MFSHLVKYLQVLETSSVSVNEDSNLKGALHVIAATILGRIILGDLWKILAEVSTFSVIV